MAESPFLPVFFYHARRRVLVGVLDTPLEIGRQREGEPTPAVRLDRQDGARIIVAPIDDVEISRSHVGLRPIDEATFEVQNLSRTLPLKIASQADLSPGETRLLAPPALLQFGSYAVRVDPAEQLDESLELEGLPERTAPPGAGIFGFGTPGAAAAPPTPPIRISSSGTFDESSLLQWLETVMGVFQSAANSHDFPMQAARAVVNIVGLDTAAMLRCSATGGWATEALHSNLGDAQASSWLPSQTLLSRVHRERRTFRHVPSMGSDTPRSLQDVCALVAAPILDGAGEVIGALYGDRRLTVASS
ncbi:MAG: hypothetical protein KDA61_07800, partial [Planctomycetales bacterium]|nr:hypothetical protein [Planctomycetales bacterium]